jgi:hypothetical protein
MNFANMSPADRAKAGVLIGLIVVLVFFVAYTVIGTVIGKKSATAKSNNKTNIANVQVTPATPPGPAPAPPDNPAEAFPTDKAFAAASKSNSLAKDPSLQMTVEDPFTPSSHKKENSTEGIVTPPSTPKKDDKPVVSFSPLPPPIFSQPGQMGNPAGNNGVWGDPGKTPGGAMGTSVADVPPPPEPEIKLIGLVHGEPSVATIQIDGRVLIARKGDALAKGYRLMDVFSDGVQIRHSKQFTTLRVGSVMNENSGKKD